MPLPYTRAAVGSRNPAKIEAVRRALARLAPACAVLAVDVASGVSDQPVGDHATREGARNRARAALSLTGAEIAFGLEGGVAHEPPVVWLVSWVAAVTRDGRSGDASGLRMPLPPAVAARLAAGDELGTIIDELFGVTASKQHAGAVGLDGRLRVAHRRVRRPRRDGLRAAPATGSVSTGRERPLADHPKASGLAGGG